jgi:hypothetical protein
MEAAADQWMGPQIARSFHPGISTQIPPIKLPGAQADHLFGHNNAEYRRGTFSIADRLIKKRLIGSVDHLDWNKDKKRMLLMAVGAVLAVVILVLIPRSNADANIESQMKSNPIQALASMAAKMRPDLDVDSVNGATQTVTLKDKNGALSAFKFDPERKTLVPVPAIQPKVAESPQPPPPEQPASTLLGWMPPWMPVYPATIPEIVSSTVTPEGDKQTIATFKSGDKPTEIVQFYQAKLQESGFKIEAASSGEPGGMIQAQDAEKKRMLILNVNARETETLTRVVTVQKK